MAACDQDLSTMRRRTRWIRTIGLADGALILVGGALGFAVPALRPIANWVMGVSIPVSGLIAYYAIMTS
ncbi:hypothetical protein [Sulfobacillus harzensis]|uniref:Uncharacterized protein n=1 Tax=Sulfobacillus harzensis TaxID=2729629 RepID=A0A7Y0L5L4_9FIRM|nr:hypothetical protein [Sulfobacillus harzensis]NMP23727.1 hypothetical protein [Sulfobacillus harzensis]